VEGEGGGGGGFGEAGEDEADGVAEIGVVAAEGGLGEAVAEFDGGVGVGVREEDGAEAAGGGGDEEATEGAVGEGVVDGLACSACFHGGGGHAEGLGNTFVQTTWRTKTGFVDGVGDGEAGLADLVAEAFLALLAGEVAGGDAEDPLEAALEGEFAEAGGGGDVVELGAFSGVLGEEVGGFGDGFGLGIGFGGGELGLAAEAGAKAGGFGEGGGGEEGDVFALGAAAGAGGAAEDFGGFDGVDELAVGGGVAREDLLPGAACEDGGGWVGGVRHAVDSCEGES